MKPRTLLVLALGCVLALVAVRTGRRYLSPPAIGIPASGGVPMNLTNSLPEPYYLQTDPAWANDTVGGSGESLSAVGCTVCSLGMAFAQLGLPVDPKTLNARLKAGGGYTRRGWLVWETVRPVSGGTFDVDVPDRPSHERIDASLRAGLPVIAKVRLWESIPHWILIVGKDSEDYLVKNPLDDQRRIQTLSTVSKRIEAIRIVRKAGT